MKVEKLKLKVSQNVSPQHDKRTERFRSRSSRQRRRRDSLTQKGRDGKKKKKERKKCGRYRNEIVQEKNNSRKVKLM